MSMFEEICKYVANTNIKQPNNAFQLSKKLLPNILRLAFAIDIQTMEKWLI